MKILLIFALAVLNLAAFSGAKLVSDARSQIGVTLSYDPSYAKLAYPMGDVDMKTGVCSDVLVRALRGQGIDLQRLIHEDMRANFGKYPKKWGLKSPDKNIDHRRVPNIATYLSRRGFTAKGEYLAGDIVTWDLGGGLTHIGIISDRKVGKNPLVIHNIGRGAQEEDILHEFKITGHYRVR